MVSEVAVPLASMPLLKVRLVEILLLSEDESAEKSDIVSRTVSLFAG